MVPYNQIMREVYYRQNKITHAEVWQTENGFQVAICSAKNVGFRESPEFDTVDECKQWAEMFIPEIKIIE